MNIALNELILTSYNWRYRVAGFFLALSILLAGSHIYASEICFLLFFLLCFFKLKFNLMLAVIGLSCLFLFTFFSIGSDRALNEMVFIILLLGLPCLGFSKNHVCIDSLVKGIALGISFSAIYAILLLIFQIISPSLGGVFELCLYGSERSTNSCGIPPYTIGGFSLHRLYGLASEPSTYGMSHVVLLSLVISNSRVKLPSSFFIIQIMSILATISITAITLLIMMFGIIRLKRTKIGMVNQNIPVRKNLKIFLIIAALLVILVVSVDGVFEALLGRTYGRIVDLFLGEDTSAFMRSTATWSPVLSFFINAPNSQILFGMGVNEYLLFLENFSTFTIVDGTLVEFAGQRGSILSTLLVSYGLVTVVTIVTMLFKLDQYRLSVVACTTFGFLFFHTSALSFSTLALIYVVGINRARVRNVK